MTLKGVRKSRVDKAIYMVFIFLEKQPKLLLAIAAKTVISNISGAYSL